MQRQLFHIIIDSQDQDDQDYQHQTSHIIESINTQQKVQKSDPYTQSFPLNQQLNQLKIDESNNALLQYIQDIENRIKQDTLSIMNQYKKFRQVIFNVAIICQLKTKRSDIETIMNQNGVVKLCYEQFLTDDIQAIQDRKNNKKLDPLQWKSFYDYPITKIKFNLEQQWKFIQDQQKEKLKKMILQQQKAKQKIRSNIDKEFKKIMIKRKNLRQKQQKLSLASNSATDEFIRTEYKKNFKDLQISNNKVDVNKTKQQIQSRNHHFVEKMKRKIIQQKAQPEKQNIKSVQSKKIAKNFKKEKQNGNKDNQEYKKQNKSKNTEQIPKSYNQQRSRDQSQKEEDEQLQFVIPDCD